jgi:hypothetical protein
MKDIARQKRWESRREYIISKKNIPCMDCGGTFPDYCMDFHHLDEDTKHEAIGRKSFIETMKKCSIKKIDEEIAKCVLVCANCHRIRHHS